MTDSSLRFRVPTQTKAAGPEAIHHHTTIYNVYCHPNYRHYQDIESSANVYRYSNNCYTYNLLGMFDVALCPYKYHHQPSL